MSGIGFWELIILLLIGLIVLGPERLPRVASQLGTWLGQARRMTRVMKRQLEEELNLEREQSIRPARLSAPPTAPPRREYDDRYSPAHPADGIGTGVDSDVAHDDDAGKQPTLTDDAAQAEHEGESAETKKNT